MLFEGSYKLSKKVTWTLNWVRDYVGHIYAGRKKKRKTEEAYGKASFRNFSLESERTILIFGGGGEVSVFGITSICSNDAVSET